MSDKKTMYCLKLYTYDYYEWESVECVSFVKDALIEHYNLLGEYGHLYADDPLVKEFEHNKFKHDERYHWCIEEVKIVS